MDIEYEERMDLEPAMKTRLAPAQYIIGKSEKEKKAVYNKHNGVCPRNEPYAYQDITNLGYPFFISAAQLIFVGRVGEEPVSAWFTIKNLADIEFWYQIKSSSREMFKIQKPVGRLEKQQTVVVSVIFYPGYKRPKAYCEYLHVYAMCDDGRDNNPFEAFGRLDRHHRPQKKRVYMDFIWHPHIEMTRAFEYGHLLDIRKSKHEHDKKNPKKKSKQPSNEDFSLNDATHKHRMFILEKQIKHDIREKHRLNFMNSDERDKYVAEIAKNKNRNKVAVVVKEPMKNYDLQYDYLERTTREEYQNVLWEGFKMEMAAKGYKIPDRKLLKSTLQQDEKYRKMRAKAQVEQDKLKKKFEEEEATRLGGSKQPTTPKGGVTPTGAKTPMKSPVSKESRSTAKEPAENVSKEKK